MVFLELVLDIVDLPVNLASNVLSIAPVHLDESFIRLFEDTILLLDNQDMPGLIDDNEVDFAKN